MRKYQVVLEHKGVNKSVFVRAGFGREAVRKAYRKIHAPYEHTRPLKIVALENLGHKNFSL